MDISDSDEDDCQLYTKSAEHFITKRNEVQAKRRELEKVIDLLSEDEVENALNDESFMKQPILEDKNSSRKSNSDISVINLEDLSDPEDNMPLAELSRDLRNRASKRHNVILPLPPRKKRPKRTSRRKKSKQPRTSSVRDLGVVVLDDDTGYPLHSLPPIDFSSCSRKKMKTSDEELGNISMESDIGKDPEEIENDDLVTLTIEWNNGQKATRKEFRLRRYQKFESVFEELSIMENVPLSRVLLMYDFKTVKPMDSPSSLNLKYYGALIGSISATEINHNKVNLAHESDNENTSGPIGGIQVKLLLQTKQTLLFTVLKHQKMDVLYQKCAEELKCEKSNLKLFFDGEHIEPSELVSDLDIEDGDVFEVHIKNS